MFHTFILTSASMAAAFGLAFNPVADRLCVISNNCQDLRSNVDTGATTTDGSITPKTAAISDSACTTSFYRIDTQVGAVAPAATLIGTMAGGETVLGMHGRPQDGLL